MTDSAATPVFTPKDVEQAFKLGWSMAYNGKGGHRGSVRASDVRFMWETLRPDDPYNWPYYNSHLRSSTRDNTELPS